MKGDHISSVDLSITFGLFFVYVKSYAMPDALIGGIANRKFTNNQDILLYGLVVRSQESCFLMLYGMQ